MVCIHTYIYNGIIYIYTQYCSAIKERMNNAICSNMDGSRHYNKWNQTKTNIISHVKSKKIYNELIIKKCAQSLKRCFLHCEIFSTLVINWKCKSKVHRDMTSYPSEWLLSKRQLITSVGKDVKKKEPSCPIRIVN